MTAWEDHFFRMPGSMADCCCTASCWSVPHCWWDFRKIWGFAFLPIVERYFLVFTMFRLIWYNMCDPWKTLETKRWLDQKEEHELIVYIVQAVWKLQPSLGCCGGRTYGLCSERCNLKLNVIGKEAEYIFFTVRDIRTEAL